MKADATLASFGILIRNSACCGNNGMAYRLKSKEMGDAGAIVETFDALREKYQDKLTKH